MINRVSSSCPPSDSWSFIVITLGAILMAELRSLAMKFIVRDSAAKSVYSV